MKLSGIKTVLYITEVNDVEREMLKMLGFHEINADGYWEYFMDVSKNSNIAYQEIGTSIVLDSDGAIFIKQQDGYYIDKDKNEYRYEAGKMVPVLIRNSRLTSDSRFEVTDSEYHDEQGDEKEYWDHEVKLANDRYVLVRNYVHTDLCYVVQNADGSTVYGDDGIFYPNFPYAENEVLDLVLDYYERNEKGFENDL